MKTALGKKIQTHTFESTIDLLNNFDEPVCDQINLFIDDSMTQENSGEHEYIEGFEVLDVQYRTTYCHKQKTVIESAIVIYEENIK